MEYAKGNTVGRTDTAFCDLKNPDDCYAFGLWCADGYHRTSSIGLTSINVDLVDAFRNFFLKYFPAERIKMRAYSHDPLPGQHYMRKSKHTAYQIYVNSRSLLRDFRIARANVSCALNFDLTPAYFAGRFDGDGSVSMDNRSDLRIVYGNFVEAEMDADLLRTLDIRATVYEYRTANTFALYVSRFDAEKFLNAIKPYSLRRRM